MKNAENSIVSNYGEGPGDQLYYPLPPRTFGLTVGYDFF